jgi:hypothetical protein
MEKVSPASSEITDLEMEALLLSLPPVAKHVTLCLFTPPSPGETGMLLCGLTSYPDLCHLGLKGIVPTEFKRPSSVKYLRPRTDILILRTSEYKVFLFFRDYVMVMQFAKLQ